MKMKSMIIFLLLLMVFVVGCGQSSAAEPTFPTQNITLIVPFQAGGGFDLQARVLAPIWEKYLPNDITITVSNQTAAGGKAGTLAVMEAPADGYTVGLMNPFNLGRMQINNELGDFDIRELTWLGQLSLDPGVLAVSGQSGIKTVEDMKNREIRVACTQDNLFQVQMLAEALDINVSTALFTGTPDFALAMLRGDMDAMMNSWPAVKIEVTNAPDGIIPLFAIAETPIEQWPEVKPSTEFGLQLEELYPVAGSARLICAPAGLPEDVRATLADSLNQAISDPEFKTGLEKVQYFASPGDASVATSAVETIVQVLEENKHLLGE